MHVVPEGAVEDSAGTAGTAEPAVPTRRRRVTIAGASLAGAAAVVLIAGFASGWLGGGAGTAALGGGGTDASGAPAVVSTPVAAGAGATPDPGAHLPQWRMELTSPLGGQTEPDTWFVGEQGESDVLSAHGLELFTRGGNAVVPETSRHVARPETGLDFWVARTTGGDVCLLMTNQTVSAAAYACMPTQTFRDAGSITLRGVTTSLGVGNATWNGGSLVLQQATR